MKAFAFVRPTTPAAASAALAEPSSVLKANGIDLLDRLKERVDEPDRVVALLDVPGLAGVTETQGGGIRIGAMTTLQALADDPLVRARLPSLAKAAGLAASPQLRRRATVGGNLAQHTRCGYYRHLSFACWKRGSETCPVRAETGVQDTAGIFGNASCASAHPSSLAPVLGSVAAVIHVHGPKGAREVLFPALWAAPARGRATDLSLDPAEVITAVEVPPVPGTRVYGYEEVRVKAAFDWALVSAAVSAFGGNGKAGSATIWLGSVAPTPHRALAAERLLEGTVTEALAEQVGAAAAEGATPLAGNAYKVDLVKVAVKRAVLEAAGRPA